MRVGILGGAFNPPHIGHLVCAQEALLQLELDKVVFVPVGEAPHRVIEQDPGAEARLTMCEYAIGADARLGVSRIEIDREGPSYTVDTLREIRASSPGDELFFVLGGDQAQGLASWREPEEIRRADITARVVTLRGADRLVFFAMPRIDLASSDIRRRVREGRPIRYLVPDDVARVIGARGYYREWVSA